MLIHVQYSDNRYDMVKDYWLEEMITAKRINRFRRSDGWVTVGVDPVRGTKPGFSYPGPERRRSVSPGPIRSAA